ncbi:MAG: nuclear transport factor 2 family protein [Actinomycetota bacterium]|nr:nuclear transport factor 2 family protein [Actinomycetota bacterium]
MTVRAGELVRTYLNALEASDLDSVTALFAEQAIVNSPLYGPMAPRQFYEVLLADTGAAKLTLRGVAEGETVDGGRLVTFWFHFDWRLPNGRPAPFDVVDVAELDADGRIVLLHIVYDTVDVRPAFEAETGTSWRT